ncbi:MULTISPECIES: NACHT domain-containing protein [unclassified Stenotrophomonas maltophilia group]|uniref:NACHT domain-containing protein n=1 Tax=unclassified Stenotrophomonas maltophilia group TaxID=2961925 RepID=UPI00131F06EB|nr:MULTISPECIES: NACHT domain-containing protein [unclassified Stenotrophomonas maltophilia group]
MDLKELIKWVGDLREAAANDTYLAIAIMLLLIFLVATSVTDFCKVIAKGFGALHRAFGTVAEGIRGGVAYKEHIQRRKQFLSVINSDLAAIGKAEAWNDQNFTDLEAEVQIDGGYYASFIHRIRKRRSHGQRRETSLIGAIDGSAERCLLLTGDPGAGKSVALRHLAVQMIERARRSKKMYEPIPLYINLRELEIDGEIDATRVKNFVIDNVRRGDADTADYLKENWRSFNENGGWFFLFDSFDEIPEVLHAANEDAQVEKFGRAIQQFMDGLGQCRGVLASREYKSPKGIVWPKLRILPLSELLQEELISNTFLSKEQKRISLRALSTSRSSTYRNPLFLTLLCRYVREHSSAPKNEHELLYRHVESLCHRDEEYVEGRWGLTPGQMKEGAAKLSRIFAFAPEMGLSPSIDEINAYSKKSGILGDSTEKIIEALTYVKVGRMDVANASRKERRFAFSHRRYHEAIFARFLTENPTVIDENELLSNPRWREYVVAILQSIDLDRETPLVAQVAKLLRLKIAGVKLHEERVSGFLTRTHDWRNDVLLHLLKIMVDVKTFNPSRAWEESEDVVEKLFAPLWSRGDLFDRLMIIRLGGAGRAEAHSSRMEYARQSGVGSLQEEAISSCQFATLPSVEAAEWIRERVARKIATATKNMDALKWEALSAELPPAYEVAVCVDRAKSLRKQHSYARALVFPMRIVERLGGLMRRNPLEERSTYERFKSVMLAVNMAPVISVAAFFMFSERAELPAYVHLAALGLLLACATNLLVTHIRIQKISLSRKISFRDAVRSFSVDYRTLLLSSVTFAMVVGVILLPGLFALWLSKYVNVLDGLKDFEVVTLGSVVGTALMSVGGMRFIWWMESRAMKQARAVLATRKTLRSAVIAKAGRGHIFEICAEATAQQNIADPDLRRTITLLSEKLLARSGNQGVRSDMADSDVASGASVLLTEFSKRKAVLST